MKRLISISMLLVIVITMRLDAQDLTVVPDSSRTVRLHRNPNAAQVLGILLPGGGHLYSGEYGRWYLTHVTVISSIATGTILFESDGCGWFGSSCTRSAQQRHKVVGASLVGFGTWLWISTAFDAPKAAARANDRHDRKTRKVSLAVDPLAVDNATNVGVSVRW